MSQKRYINFGSTVTSDGINDSRHQFIDAIVLSGGLLSVLNNNLVVGALAVSLPSGIILTEDLQQELELLGIPGDTSKNYTIVYTHINQDILFGTTAILEAYPGLLSPQDLVNSVILGWVQYPGNSIPLALDHITTTRSNRIKSNISKADIVSLGVKLPPFSTQFLSFSQSGASITITDICDKTDLSHITVYTQLSNNDISVGQVVKVLPFLVGEYKPGRIILDLFVGVDAILTVSVIDATGEEIFPLTNTIQNTSNFITRELVLNKNYHQLFAQGSTFLVKLVMNLNPSNQIKLRSIGYSTYNLPY